MHLILQWPLTDGIDDLKKNTLCPISSLDSRDPRSNYYTIGDFSDLDEQVVAYSLVPLCGYSPVERCPFEFRSILSLFRLVLLGLLEGNYHRNSFFLLSLLHITH